MALTLSNGVRFTIRGTWNGAQPVQTVWHAIVTHISTRPAACLSAAGSLATEWAQHVCPQLANNYSFQDVAWVDLASEDGSTGTYSAPGVTQGGSSVISASPYNGILVTKNISDKGRGKRSGRVFIPGVGGSNIQEDGQVTQAVRDAADAALEVFRSAFNGFSSASVASQRLVVAHTPSVEVTETITHRVPAKDGLMTASDITSFSAQPLVSGLRQRITA